MKNRNGWAGMVLGIVMIVCFLGFSPAAHAAQKLTVSDIKAVYIEKGAVNYTVTVRAAVTNKGKADNFVIDVEAVDADGYQLTTLKMDGFIGEGQKKSLVGRVTLKKSTFEQSAAWQRLK